MLKVVTFLVCLAAICLFLALGQKSRANNVFHLMTAVLWMLFMFVGNMVLPDLELVSGDQRLQVGIMLAWLGVSHLLARGCIRLLRRKARI
jgi:hypothetical protein